MVEREKVDIVVGVLELSGALIRLDDEILASEKLVNDLYDTAYVLFLTLSVNLEPFMEYLTDFIEGIKAEIMRGESSDKILTDAVLSIALVKRIGEIIYSTLEGMGINPVMFMMENFGSEEEFTEAVLVVSMSIIRGLEERYPQRYHELAEKVKPLVYSLTKVKRIKEIIGGRYHA